MVRIHSIRFKLVLFLIAILLSIFSISAYIVIDREFENSKVNLIERAKSFSLLSARPIIENYKIYYESGFYKYKEIIENIMPLNSDIKKIQILDLQGKILFDSNELIEGKYSGEPVVVKNNEILERIRKLESSLEETIIDDKRAIDIVQPYLEEWGRHDYSVRYYFSFHSVEQNLIQIIYNVGIAAAILFIISLTLIFFFSNRFITRPLGKLTDGVKMLSKGRFGYKVDVRSNDEIGNLADNFNKMAEELKESRKTIEKYTKELEQKVSERTKELEKSKKELESKMEELEKFNKIAVGRELKMIELKKKIKELGERLKGK